MRRSGRWGAIQWPLLGLLGLAALVLGWLGFRDHGVSSGQPLGVVAAAYRSIQLFVLEFGASEPPAVPATLEVARVLAPAVAGYAAARALLVLFRDQIDRLTLRWRRNHVIVCGLGWQGATLVRALDVSGWKVAGVDLDPARRLGVPVISGDATEEAVLRSAGARRAAHVVALCGSDEINSAVALAARRVSGSNTRPVVHVHVLNPRLGAVLRSEALAGATALEFFTIHERGARKLLDRHPPTAIPGSHPRIAIVGLGRLGKSLLVEAMRRFPEAGIVVVDREAAPILQAMSDRRGGFGESDRVRAIDLDVTSPEFEQAEFLTAGGACSVDVVYVCLGDASEALSAALALLHRLKELPSSRFDRPVDLVVRITRRSGLADLVADTAEDRSAAVLHTFDLHGATLDESLLLGATREEIAAALHREYLSVQQAAGRRLGTSGTLQRWEDLSDEVRNANRAAAAGVGDLLRAIGADLVPLVVWGAEPIVLTPGEVELLAILEHRRWVGWKREHGFRPGPVSDFEGGISPYLVDWAELGDEAREWVRAFVRVLPAVLTDAGQQVVRLDRGLARSLHDEYVRMRTGAGDTPADNPSLVAWEQLPESLRASNRDQAAHIRVKLLALGYDAAPGEAGPVFEFTSEQVELLAKMEHDRWVEHRRFEGWESGDRKDAAAKVTPHLISWEDLDETMREIDREFVRAIPRVLADSGLRIVPMSG